MAAGFLPVRMLAAPVSYKSLGLYAIYNPDILSSFANAHSLGGREDTSQTLFIYNSVLSRTIPLTTHSAYTGRKTAINYFVKKGDTISSIAAKFGLSTKTILWANNLYSSSIIRPGQRLLILPVDGVRHIVKKGETLSSIAYKYKANLDEIIAFNGLSEGGFIVQGQELVIPGGMKPISQVRRFAGRASKSLKVAFGYFSRPVYPAVRTQGLHPFNAVDLANRCGTPIHSAASGRIKIADAVGWNGGYGKYVEIAHPNGTQTLYAHLSRIYVRPGQFVSRGQVIGLMGTTGHSTGCHLHFEVHGARNPFAYRWP